MKREDGHREGSTVSSGMSLLEYLLLAVLSIFWPLLITVVVVGLRTSHPLRVLSAFLAGGLLTTVTVGLALVFSFDGSSVLTRHERTANAAIDIVVGLLALAAAAAVAGRRSSRRAPSPEQHPGRWSPERLVGSTRLAFVGGIVLNLFPGVVPFIALRGIAEGGYTLAETVVLVVVFYVILFATVEIPILGYVVAPVRTVELVRRLNAWLDRNAVRVAADVLALAGAFFLVRGLLEL